MPYTLDLADELEIARRLVDFACACHESFELDVLMARVGALLFDWVQADVLTISMPNGMVGDGPSIHVSSRQPLLPMTEDRLRELVAEQMEAAGLPGRAPNEFEVVHCANLTPLHAVGRADWLYPLWEITLPLGRGEDAPKAIVSLFGFQDWIFSERSDSLIEQALSTSILGQAVGNARRVAELQLRMTEDPLTGALNRRGFEDAMYREAQRAQRSGRPMSLLLIDIDHFKQVNDDFGHMVGDDVLRELCADISRTLRCSDLFCRLGGDEFAVILPDVEQETAELVAERLSTACAGVAAGEERRPVTMSIGVAALDPFGALDLGAFFARADEALYAAKRAGRGRVAALG